MIQSNCDVELLIIISGGQFRSDQRTPPAPSDPKLMVNVTKIMVKKK